MTDEENKITSSHFWFIIVIVVFLGTVMYSSFDIGYKAGYNESNFKMSKPPIYKCHDGFVHRRTMDYWESTKQACKKLEEVK